MLQFEKQIEKKEQDIEQQLLDINLFYLVSPDQNEYIESAKEIEDPRLSKLSKN
jgi:hypothetical protein